jgi:sedoheptulokinase
MARTLGIDVGTTTISAVLYNTNRESPERIESLPHRASIACSHPGRREQDWRKILECLGKILSAIKADEPGRLVVDGISVTGQMHGFILLERSGLPLSPFITWQDSRAAEISQSGYSWLQEFLRIYDDTTHHYGHQSVGYRPACGYMGPTLFVLIKTGEIPSKAIRAAMMHDWITFELTGRKSARCMTDRSFAESSGLCLPLQGRWNEALISALGIKDEFLSEVVESGNLIGQTGHTEWDLAEGIPVFAGLGDNQASFLGSAGELKNTVLVNIGTAGQISLAVNRPVSISGIDTRIFVEDSYLLVGASLCAGDAYALLKEFITDIGRRFYGATRTDEYLYRKMIDIAPAKSELECQTTFCGTRADPHTRGRITNIGKGNFRISDLCTAVSKGIVQELYDFYAKMQTPRDRLVGSGNALRNNVLIQNTVERCFGMELRIPAIQEEAALGAALTACVGLGVYKSFDEAGGAVR